MRHIINSEYEIRDSVGGYNRVDLERRTCSCKELDKLSIPCTHVVAAPVNSKHNVESLVAEEFSNSYWGMAYSGSINPANPNNYTGGEAGENG